MHYEQITGTGSFTVAGNIGDFDQLTPDLSLDDSILVPVKEAWRVVTEEVDENDYMQFDDREGAIDDDDDAFAS
jgi:hypothetical protein